MLHRVTVKPQYLKHLLDHGNLFEIIRIYHGCEGETEKIRPEGHYLASRGLPSDVRL